MSSFNVARSSAVVSQVAYRARETPKCLTTADVARVLQVTDRWVRWLARTDQLATYTQTRSGLWLFLERDVQAFMLARAKARLRGPRERLLALRPQMAKAVGPRQGRFRLVPRGESSDPPSEVKRAVSFSGKR